MIFFKSFVVQVLPLLPRPLTMNTIGKKYRIRQCSKCPGDTEYYCVSCLRCLCPHCKENHVTDLHDLTTEDYDVVIYSDKFNNINKKGQSIPKQEICARHPCNVYIKYCETCKIPVCDLCFGQKTHRFPFSLFDQNKHNVLDIQKTFRKKATAISRNSLHQK